MLTFRFPTPGIASAAAGLAIVVVALLAPHREAPAAQAVAQPAVESAPTLHGAVDWARVATAPVSTGMSIAAYDR